MAVRCRGPWGVPHCSAFVQKTPGGILFFQGHRRLSTPACQSAQAAAAATRGSLPAEGCVNKAGKSPLFASSSTANTPKPRLSGEQTLINRSRTSSNDTAASSSNSSNTPNSSNADTIGADSSRGCSEEDAETLQEAVEESFSVFDVIYRNSLSSRDGSKTASATQNAKPTRSKPRATEPGNVQKAVDSNQKSSIALPSSRVGDGPAVLLSILRDLNNARVRTPEAWAPHLLLLMQQLPLLSSSEIQQATALLAAAGCRPPLLLQGLCEAYRWRAVAKQTEASQTILFLDSLRRLRYLPCVSHLHVYFGALERRRKCFTVGELLKIQRFLDELSVPSDVASLPFLVSVLPQLKRNATALKPPEAAALASLLLKRQELDRQTAECLSAAVYEHLGGPSSMLLLPHEPLSGAASQYMPQEHRSAHLKACYYQHMLQRQQERLASPSSLSSLLHLGNSLAAANLKQVPSTFCWALEREVELHWAALTPTEVSATLNLLAKMKHRPTSALNKLGLAVQHSLHLYTPNLTAHPSVGRRYDLQLQGGQHFVGHRYCHAMNALAPCLAGDSGSGSVHSVVLLLSGCLSSFDSLLYRHRSLFSSLSTLFLNKLIAPLDQNKQSDDDRQHYPRPSPRFVGQLSAVSATMPTPAAASSTTTGIVAFAASAQPQTGQMPHRQEHELVAESLAKAQTTVPLFYGRQPPKRLPFDAHLPPPLASERYTGENEIKTSPLPKENEKPGDTFNSVLPSEGMQDDCRCLKAVDSPGLSALPTTTPRSTNALQAKTERDAAAPPVLDAGTLCSATASIDPLLASALLQHLSHIQHRKDPELLSRLLASVSAAIANYGQQHRLTILFEQQTAARLHGSRFGPVTRNSPASGHVTCVESVELMADTEHKVAATPLARMPTETPFDYLSSAAKPASLSATEAAVTGHRGSPMGTHEVREGWAEFASAAMAAADSFCPRWGKYRGTCFSGQTADASCGPDRTHNEAAKLDINAGSSRSKSRIIRSDQETIRRLKEQGLHKALQFVTLPWSAFVSQFRKAIDLDTGRTSPSSSSELPPKGGKRMGFVPAGAEVARTITRREARLAHLYRLWGVRGPPGLRRLRRRHLRRLAMKMKAVVSGALRSSAAVSKPASGRLLGGDDRKRVARILPARATHSSVAAPAPVGKKKNIVYGKCAANAMRRWACCRRAFLQPFQLVSLFSRHSSPTIGVEAAASAKTDAAGKAPLPCFTGISLPQQQVQLQLPPRQKFPFGIAFSDTSQGLLIDTGPLLPPVLPTDAPSSLKKQIKRQYDKKMKYAAQAQALLQRQQQRRQNTLTPIVGRFVESTSATAADTANPTTVQSLELASTSSQLSAVHSLPMISPRDSAQSPAAVTSSRARKEEQHRSRLLHAASHALSAAANMRVLTLRIARPFVVQLPLLCAESAFVATRALAAAKDLRACCAVAAAALQTLGLRLDEPSTYTHSARRRIPRPPTPDLATMREEVLVSLEMAFRSPRFLALWQQVQADVALLEHTANKGKAGDDSHTRLSHLLPQAAYLYSVVFQALINEVQREHTRSALITAWQQQQQRALQFCNLLANAIATMGRAAIPYTLASLTYMLNACRCLASGATSMGTVPQQQQLKQPLIMLLRRTEKAIMHEVEQELRDSDANTEEHSTRDIRFSLIALVRSHLSTRGSASPATAEAEATAKESVHSVVSALANEKHLTSNTINRWVTEAAAAEELRLQRVRPR